MSPEDQRSSVSGAYHPYHITKAYPMEALCCIARTFHWQLFISAFHLAIEFLHYISLQGATFH